MDIVNFMRDNGQMWVTENHGYFLIKFFDSDEDGKLHYPDYLQMILPCTNAKMRSEQTQKRIQECRPEDYLSLDVEQDMMRLIRAEMEFHRELEDKK